MAYLDLEEVLRCTVDLLEGLLTRFRQGLHRCGGLARCAAAERGPRESR